MSKTEANKLPPAIKWSGSKRRVARAIAALFPPAERFIDPFVGGGSILPWRPARAAVAGDIIPELIALWKLIQNNPASVCDGYEQRWKRLAAEGHTAYYAIRDSFNRKRDALDFLFLTRTCVNGLIRFNASGEFNNSLHHTRPGIDPGRFESIVRSWSDAIQGIEFVCADFRQTLRTVGPGDVVFLDPPYANNRGRYQPGTINSIDLHEALARLNRLGSRWVLTYDGAAGARSYEAEIPASLYRHHISVRTGLSPFTRLMRTGVDTVVESVYLNFDVSPESLRQCADGADEIGSNGAGDSVQDNFVFVGEELDANRDVHFAVG